MPADTISAWSYSRLKVFETCPYQAWLKFVQKRPEPDTIDRTHADRGIAVHSNIENYIRGDTDQLLPPADRAKEIIDPLRDAYPHGTVEIESDWGFDQDWQSCDFHADHVWCRMKLDALHRPDDQYAHAYDWKTGKKYGNEVAHAQQGQQYAVGTFMRLPALELLDVSFVYVDQPKCGPPLKRTYTRQQVMAFFKSINDRALRMTSATTFPAKPNKINCRWCPYSPNNGGDRSCPWGQEI